jgi:hypothetical protein
VTVFWREFDAGKPLPCGDALDGPAYHVEEGCAVPIDRLRKFIEGKGVSFVWDDHTDAWQKCSATDLCPGMIVMLSRQSGGYDASQGWTGSASTRLDDVPPPGAFDAPTPPPLQIDSFAAQDAPDGVHAGVEFLRHRRPVPVGHAGR